MLYFIWKQGFLFTKLASSGRKCWNVDIFWHKQNTANNDKNKLEKNTFSRCNYKKGELLLYELLLLKGIALLLRFKLFYNFISNVSQK